jgi:5-methyltetrahydropteroyltriglutamate--homocysteine methyltransferase
MSRREPPFRAEQIGSLLRPPELVRAIVDFEAGRCSPAELAAIEDVAIDQAIAAQERIGLQSITDGEYRRKVYLSSFLERGMGGVRYSREGGLKFRNSEGDEIDAGIPVVGGKLSWKGPVHVSDFRYVQARTERTPKITLPGPCNLHFYAGRQNISSDAYPELSLFWDDVVEIWRCEIDALARAGCRYVQLDETVFAKFGDPAIQEHLERGGTRWRELLSLYIGIINRVASDPPPGMTIGIHMCRGNARGFWQAEGGYDAVAEQMFNSMALSAFFLEYDTPRAGDFSPLRFVPKSKFVVLGLVSTKVPALEDARYLQQRIEQATKYISLDQLCLSPQCGFASDYRGNNLTSDEQFAKLSRVVEVARLTWKDA